jgi:hypothetical protein
MAFHPRRTQLLVAVSLLLVVAVAPPIGLARASARAQSSCSRAQLSARSYLGGGAAGHAGAVIVLNDRGGACVLRGYLRVRLLDGRRLPIGTLATRAVSTFITGETLRVHTVWLAPGGKASFEIDYTEEPSVLGPGNRSCELISWLGIELAGGRLTVPVQITPCGGRFSESPVQAGVLPHLGHLALPRP